VADAIRRIDYYYVSVPDKPGEAARILSALHQAGINLLGVSAFPHGARRSQVDFIPEDSATFTKAAKSMGLTLSKKKSCFLIQGDDRPGAIAEITGELADAKVNMTSVQAFCAGSGRYGGVLWVKPPDMRKAAKALGVTAVPRSMKPDQRTGRPEADIEMEELEKLCAMQCTDEEIAAWFNVSTRTIERRRKAADFNDVMERGKGRIRGRLLSGYKKGPARQI
jgi:hypothetical protein